MKTFRIIVISCLTLASLVACSEGNPAPSPATPPREAPKQKIRNVVLFLGDSLTAGYGLTPAQAYPALLAEKWKQRGLPYRVRNAGVSGYTSGDVRHNLGWSLSEDVCMVFLAIGANDGLRMQKIRQCRANIIAIIEKCKAARIPVAIAGMKLPPNYGLDYTRRFEKMYHDVAEHCNIELMPFLLQDVAGVSHLNISDGIHPNAQGQKIIARHVDKFLAPILPKISTKE